MIVIISSRDDWHAQMVQQKLSQRGSDVRILDWSNLGQGMQLTFGVGAETDRLFFDGEESPIDLRQVKSVWYRRPAGPRIDSTVFFPHDRRFAEMEWKQSLSGILSTWNTTFVNPPIAQANASKPLQLDVANRVGLNIPDTLITNDVNSAEQFVKKHKEKVVHKVFASTQQRFLETCKWHPRDRHHFDRLSIAPVIFQEMIVGPYECRVTIVGNHVFAARIATSLQADTVDVRLDHDTLYEAFDLPREMKGKLLDLMKAMGLVYATIDLKMDKNREFFFLELNPQGQFLFIEVMTGMPIASAVADLLMNN